MAADVPYFVSYAQADKPDVNRFLTVLEPLLAASANFRFIKWMDRDILPGEQWKSEIDQALAQSRFGLLLVSPQFLASRFITQAELGPLLDKPIVVPVALHPIPFNGTLDLKGLADRQVFRDSAGRSFDQCGRMHTRRAFARELHDQIHRLLAKYPA